MHAHACARLHTHLGECLLLSVGYSMVQILGALDLLTSNILQRILQEPNRVAASIPNLQRIAIRPNLPRTHLGMALAFHRIEAWHWPSTALGHGIGLPPH